VVPQLEALQKEGEEGRRRITQYQRYGTVALALFQSFLIATALESGQFGEGAVLEPGWSFRLMVMLTLSTGTIFLMWLGEQITERGIGNGISLLIFAGIVVTIPSALGQLIELVRLDQVSLLGALVLLAICVLVIGFVVLFERAQRRIPIQHARRVVGRRMVQGGMSYFPLRVNTAGVIPPIFASSILTFPLMIGGLAESSVVNQFFQDWLGYGGSLYNALYVGLILFFAFFYTAIVINPVDVAENIKKAGGFIPGIRPGRSTAEYIDRVLGRLTLIGALYVAAVCVLPVLLTARFGIPFYFGGTALLIVVGVSLDTIGQIEAHLVSRQYEGFVKGTRLRGRLGR
jgi:preprotein translocase subunit SecY